MNRLQHLKSPRIVSARQSATLRAIVLDGSHVKLTAPHPAPVAGEGEAVIRLLKAAVGSLDIELAQQRTDFRGVMGREFVGVVELVASRAPAAQAIVGRRVVGSPVTSCGACDMCQRGSRGHCRNRTIVGYQNRDGCFADRFALPVQNLHVVDDSIDDDHAVFACDLAAAIQAVQQLTIANKPYITVVGDTSMALLTAQVMARLNASVRLVGWQSQKLAICEKWGVKHRHADDVGRRADQDIVVECSGSPQGLALALQLVRPRGKVVLKSMVNPQLPGAPHFAVPGELIASVIFNELELIGSGFGPVSEAIAVLARREVDVLSLISRRLNLSDGAAILTAAARPDAIKVLIEP